MVALGFGEGRETWDRTGLPKGPVGRFACPFAAASLNLHDEVEVEGRERSGGGGGVFLSGVRLLIG